MLLMVVHTHVGHHVVSPSVLVEKQLLLSLHLLVRVHGAALGEQGV